MAQRWAIIVKHARIRTIKAKSHRTVLSLCLLFGVDRQERANRICTQYSQVYIYIAFGMVPLSEETIKQKLYEKCKKIIKWLEYYRYR